MLLVTHAYYLKCGQEWKLVFSKLNDSALFNKLLINLPPYTLFHLYTLKCRKCMLQPSNEARRGLTACVQIYFTTYRNVNVKKSWSEHNCMYLVALENGLVPGIIFLASKMQWWPCVLEDPHFGWVRIPGFHHSMCMCTLHYISVFFFF